MKTMNTKVNNSEQQTEKNATIIALRAQTSIHAGASDGNGVVDLPIQRESHSDYPCIFGSSMKGALRAFAKDKLDEKDTKKLFGPEPNADSTANNMGSLLISDARLLLLPVRSLTGQFRWVTCPAILQRLCQDKHRFLSINEKDIGIEVNDEEVIILTNTPETAETNNDAPDRKLFLEEYAFKVKVEDNQKVKDLLTAFIDEKLLTEQLAIISNNSFAYLCRFAIPVNARNVLNEDKTSDNLWYEETLPTETVMYVGLSGKSEGLQTITDRLVKNKYLQVGGNETIGMGWFMVKELSDKSNDQGA